MFYLHETTNLVPDAADRFTAAFDAEYEPLMADHGARLVALWETLPFSFAWPQTVALWEIDDMRTLGALGRAQRQDAEGAARFSTWRSAIAGLVTGGEGRILTPSSGSPTIDRMRELAISPGVCVQERVATVPGMQFDYVEQLERLYVPWAERNGRRFLGAYTTNWRNSEAILVWAWESGWDTLGENYGRQKHIITHDPELSAWMVLGTSLRHDWNDAILHSVRAYEGAPAALG